MFGYYPGYPEDSSHETTNLFGSLGITQHLIKGGIAWLEEVRGLDGALEDLFIRVRGNH
jgi:dipeptidyl-peptidase-3